MKNSTILIVLGVIVLLVGGFVFVNAGDKGINGNVVADDAQRLDSSTQRAVLSQERYNYKDVEIEAGKPAAISADPSVGGCLRSVVFNVNGKRYSKYLKTPQDTLVLPALEKGTYNFACSMGMGYGKLIVK